MEATIGTWGNSEAVRLPQAVLRLTGLRHGDRVSIGVTDSGGIEIAPIARKHRRVLPKRGVTFESLFDGYDPPEGDLPGADAWPDDDLVGAEWEAWAR